MGSLRRLSAGTGATDGNAPISGRSRDRHGAARLTQSPLCRRDEKADSALRHHQRIKYVNVQKNTIVRLSGPQTASPQNAMLVTGSAVCQ